MQAFVLGFGTSPADSSRTKAAPRSHVSRAKNAGHLKDFISQKRIERRRLRIRIRGGAKPLSPEDVRRERIIRRSKWWSETSETCFAYQKGEELLQNSVSHLNQNLQVSTRKKTDLWGLASLSFRV